MKAFKVKVTPEQSEELQKSAFKRGYVWYEGGGVRNTSNKFLYLSESGTITRGDDAVRFDSHLFEELSFEEAMECLKVTPDSKRNTSTKTRFVIIEQDGVLYRLETIDGNEIDDIESYMSDKISERDKLTEEIAKIRKELNRHKRMLENGEFE